MGPRDVTLGPLQSCTLTPSVPNMVLSSLASTANTVLNGAWISREPQPSASRSDFKVNKGAWGN